MSDYLGDLGRNNPIIRIVLLILFIIAFFYIAKWIYLFLLWSSPVIIILTAIIDHQVIINFGKTLWNSFQQSVFKGLLMTGFVVIAFPLVCIYLLAKALIKKKFKQVSKDLGRSQEENYTDYEIIDEDPLDLPDMEIKKDSQKME